jgi:hypothetical protein
MVIKGGRVTVSSSRWFNATTLGFLNDPKRVNVILSRARRQVLMGDLWREIKGQNIAPLNVRKKPRFDGRPPFTNYNI